MFSFAAPLFLLGSLGLAVPVLLHLLNRQTRQTITFPSVQFILRGRLPQSGKRRLRDLLLLLLRLLIFACIVLAFARPQWQPTTEAAGVQETEKQQPARILLLDTSASLNGWSHWQALQEMVSDYLDQASRKLRYGVITSANTDQVVLDYPARRKEVKNAVNPLSPTMTGGNHQRAIKKALDQLPAQGGKILIFSDFQNTDWSQALNNLSLPEKTRIELRPIEAPFGENCGITHATVSRLSKDEHRVVTSIQNYGKQPQDRQLKAYSGDELISQRDVTIPAGERIHIDMTFATPPSQKGLLTLNPDAATFDDQYHVWLGETPQIPVLVTAPVNKDPDKESELLFVTKALSVSDVTGTKPFKIQQMDTDFFSSIAPKAIDGLVIAGGAGYFKKTDWDNLKTFIAKGGTAICTPGNAPMTQFSGFQRHNLLNARYLGLHQSRNGRQASQPAHVGWINPQSTFIELFEEKHSSDLFVTPIHKHVRLKVQDDDQTNILLKSESDDPLLIRRDYKKGRLYVFAFAFDTQWSHFAVSTAFVPFLRELFDPEQLQPSGGVKQVVCGAPLPVIPNLIGEYASVPEDASDTPNVLVINDTPFEINVPVSESVPVATSQLRLKEQLANQSKTTQDQDNASISSDSSETAIVPFWPWLALIAALLLPVETLIANRKHSNA